MAWNNLYKTPILPILGIIGFSGNLDVYGALNFNNADKEIIKIAPDRSTGLNDIFVVYNTENISLQYTSQIDNNNVKWYTFSNLGAAFAEPISNIKYSQDNSTLEQIIPDHGYLIEDNDKQYYFWIINYFDKTFNIHSLSPSNDQSCDATSLTFIGDCEPLKYYTINGRSETLSRDILIEYTSLTLNEENEQYEEISMQKNIANISGEILITPPVYCSTNFHISGDRFLKQWGMTESYESGGFSPVATSVYTTATTITNETEDRDNSNQIMEEVDGLGGSAPCDIEFKAVVSDAVIHNEWQMANDEDFNDITYRIQEQDLSYTFTHDGTSYVRFVGSNSDGSCESIGDTYKIVIGSSRLEIPNAFSPNGDGVNDEWKVSYRSLIEFECWIFDKNGHEIFHFNDPAMGWDGKRNGKQVKSGVYYYVITATGSDNIKYKKSGDINIIYSTNNRDNSSSDY